MGGGELVTALLAGAWCAAIVYRDLSSKTLPNWLTLGGAACALVARAVLLGPASLPPAIAGGLVGGLFLLIPFFLRAAGGGDVKLLFAMGILIGWPGILAALFWVSVAGVLTALVHLVMARAMWRWLHHVAMVLCNPTYDRAEGRDRLGELVKLRVSFGTPIVAGTLMAFLVPL